MPNEVRVKSVAVTAMNGGGYLVYTEFDSNDMAAEEKAVDTAAKMKKRLKLAIDEMVADNTPKAKNAN
jgi:hypothetical protein